MTSAWMQVLEAVLELAGDQAVLMAQSDAPWHSVTFKGTRHTATLRFTGDAVPMGEAFIAEVRNFPDLPGQTVAEAKVIWTHRAQGELAVQIEVLLLDDERVAA